MTRKLITLALLAGLAPTTRAQDMPLSQILIEGEGWKKVEKPGMVPEPPEPFGVVLGKGGLLYNVYTYSPNRDTVFVPGESFILAAPLSLKGGIGGGFSPYAPLRLKAGEKSSKVFALATDRDGRIYAATEIGVQVFDPTGRLCGVLTPAAPGKPDRCELLFEGNQLTLWIGDEKYTRKLNTSGAK